MILVTTPNGNIGRHVVSELVALGAPVRVLARDPAKASDHGGRVEVVQGDLDRPETLDAAFRGAERLVLLSPGPDVVAQDAALIEAARRAGLRQVVLVSSLGVEIREGVAGGQGHLPGEARLRESGLGWTLVRPSEFMTNVLWWRPMLASGAIALPAGDGAVGFVDPRDIASVAVRAVTTPGHEGKIYRVTGPEALRIADLAAQLGEIVGRPVHFVDVPPDAWAQQVAAIRPAPFVAAMTAYYAAVRAGEASRVTSDVPDLLGRPARSFATWARENAAALR